MSEIEKKDSFAVEYSLDEQVMSEIIVERLAAIDTSVGSGIKYFEATSDEPMANVGRSIERVVFEKWFGNTAEDMTREYGPYEHQSTFFVAVDTEKAAPVGVMRTIRAHEPGQSLKLLDDVRSSEQEDMQRAASFVTDEAMREKHGIETLENVWELGTIAILPQYRNSQRSFLQKGVISAQLIRAMYLSARAQGVEHMIAAMDVNPYEKMVKKHLGLPYVPLCDSEPFSYLGSDQTLLIYGHVPEFYSYMRRKMSTANGMLAHSALRLLVQGKDDQAIYLPPEHTPRVYRG